MLWRVHYAKGVSFSSDDGEPWQAPRDGVLAVVMPEKDNGRELLARKEYYWFDGQRWFGGDLFGLWDHLMNAPRQCVLAGRYVPNDVYIDAINHAISDDGFLPKSANLPGETY